MKVKEYASTLESQVISMKRKVMRLAKEDKLEEDLYAWFILKRSLGAAISRLLVAENMLQHHCRINNE